MEYTCTYKSELGNILLAADEIGLTGLWFEGQKYFANTLPEEHISQETPILTDAKKMAGYIFFRRRTEIYSFSSSNWFSIQTGSMADSIADTLWTDNYIWRNRQTNV